MSSPSSYSSWSRVVLAGLLLSAAGSAGYSQDRPKIGLALCGGGAKGGAHVGVIKVMEELNIPIDYIAGTSIGAIVGGLYASGMTSDELAEALASIDWAEALRDKPPRRDLSFRRKEDDSRYLFDLEVGVGKDGLRWPAGFISGQNLFFLLQSLTLPVADIDDFDRLPIPFRAVATNVNTGKMEVLSRGYLATAIRASMAIPGVFAPVEIDGKLLVDGGLVNNLPVDVAFEMGADIVIAIDLGAELSERQVGASVVQIYQQTMRMLTRPNVESRLEAADLVINPGVANYGTMSFDQILEIMAKGEEAARERTTELARYSIEPEAYRQHREAQLPPTAESFRISFVDFEGNKRVDDRQVRDKIRLEAGEEIGLRVFGDDLAHLLGARSKRDERTERQLEGEEPLDLRALFEDLRRLYGIGEFEQVDFAFEEREGEQGVVIRMKEKPWGPNYLHFGLQLGTDMEGGTLFQLLTNLTKTQINTRGAEWRSDLLLGTDRGLFSEFYQPLDFGGSFFVAPRVDLQDRRVKVFEDGESLAELNTDATLFGVDLGYQAGSYAELRLGVEVGSGEAKLETGVLPPEIVEQIRDFDVGGVRFLIRSDRLDSVMIPRRGWRSSFRAYQSLEELGADTEYTRLDWRGSQYFSRGRHTGVVGGQAGWSPGSILPLWDEFALGGLGSLSGYEDNELRGQYLGLARLGYYYQIFGKWFLGGFGEAGNTWQTSDEASFDNLRYAGTVFLAKETAIGPVYLAYALGEEGRSKFYFTLGRTFGGLVEID